MISLPFSVAINLGIFSISLLVLLMQCNLCCRTSSLQSTNSLQSTTATLQTTTQPTQQILNYRWLLHILIVHMTSRRDKPLRFCLNSLLRSGEIIPIKILFLLQFLMILFVNCVYCFPTFFPLYLVNIKHIQQTKLVFIKNPGKALYPHQTMTWHPPIRNQANQNIPLSWEQKILSIHFT